MPTGEKTLPQFQSLTDIQDSNLFCGYQTDLGHWTGSQIKKYTFNGKYKLLTGGTYTVLLSDNGYTLISTGSVQNIELPNSTLFPVGFKLKVKNFSTGPNNDYTTVIYCSGGGTIDNDQDQYPIYLSSNQCLGISLYIPNSIETGPNQWITESSTDGADYFQRVAKVPAISQTASYTPIGLDNQSLVVFPENLISQSELRLPNYNPYDTNVFLPGFSFNVYIPVYNAISNPTPQSCIIVTDEGTVIKGPNIFYPGQMVNIRLYGYDGINKIWIITNGALQSVNNLSDVESVSTSRINLGLGTIAVQDADDVIITGGNIDGTDIGIDVIGDANFNTMTYNSLFEGQSGDDTIDSDHHGKVVRAFGGGTLTFDSSESLGLGFNVTILSDTIDLVIVKPAMGETFNDGGYPELNLSPNECYRFECDGENIYITSQSFVPSVETIYINLTNSITLEWVSNFRIYLISSSDPITITLPSTETHIIPDSYKVQFINIGSGLVTFSSQGGDVLVGNNGNNTLNSNQDCYIYKVIDGTPNKYYQTGDSESIPPTTQPVIEVSASTLLISSIHQNSILEFTNPNGCVITLPNNDTDELPVGFECEIILTSPTGLLDFEHQGTDILVNYTTYKSNQRGKIQKTDSGSKNTWINNGGTQYKINSYYEYINVTPLPGSGSGSFSTTPPVYGRIIQFSGFMDSGTATNVQPTINNNDTENNDTTFTTSSSISPVFDDNNYMPGNLFGFQYDTDGITAAGIHIAFQTLEEV